MPLRERASRSKSMIMRATMITATKAMPIATIMRMISPALNFPTPAGH